MSRTAKTIGPEHSETARTALDGTDIEVKKIGCYGLAGI